MVMKISKHVLWVHPIKEPIVSNIDRIANTTHELKLYIDAQCIRISLQIIGLMPVAVAIAAKNIDAWQLLFAFYTMICTL